MTTEILDLLFIGLTIRTYVVCVVGMLLCMLEGLPSEIPTSFFSSHRDTQGVSIKKKEVGKNGEFGSGVREDNGSKY